jgi:plasmid stabilization system protein ParE
MKVRFTRRAARDLNSIFNYIAQDRPGAAARVVARIEEFVGVLADVPGVGQVVSSSGAQACVLPDLPYRVFYRVVREELQVLQIRHARRRPLNLS